MAVLELTDKPFFADKNRAFWNLHSAGWAGAVILRAASGIAQGQPVSFLVPILISAVTGYSITLLLSVIYRFLIDQRPFITWSLTFVAVSLATIGYAYMDVWLSLIHI
jgi:two-component system LytT family sensor kinase